MKTIINILLFITYVFSMTGLELAQLVESREKPKDVKSLNTMLIINKDGRIKTLELISMSKDDSEKQMIWFLKPSKDIGISFLKEKSGKQK